MWSPRTSSPAPWSVSACPTRNSRPSIRESCTCRSRASATSSPPPTATGPPTRWSPRAMGGLYEFRREPGRLPNIGVAGRHGRHRQRAVRRHRDPGGHPSPRAHGRGPARRRVHVRRRHRAHGHGALQPVHRHRGQQPQSLARHLRFLPGTRRPVRHAGGPGASVRADGPRRGPPGVARRPPVCHP